MRVACSKITTVSFQLNRFPPIELTQIQVQPGSRMAPCLPGRRTLWFWLACIDEPPTQQNKPKYFHPSRSPAISPKLDVAESGSPIKPTSINQNWESDRAQLQALSLTKARVKWGKWWWTRPLRQAEVHDKSPRLFMVRPRKWLIFLVMWNPAISLVRDPEKVVKLWIITINNSEQ